MAVYTILTLSEVKKIAKLYGLKVQSFIATTGGKANSNYWLKTDKGDFSLTVAEEKPKSELKRLAKILSWLNQHDFYTSKILSTLDGKIVTTFKGKPITIKNWIEGKVISDITPKLQKQLGQALAKLHQVPIPKQLLETHYYGIEKIKTYKKQKLDVNYQKWLAEELTFLKKNLPTDLPTGFIHGDLFFDNVLFKKGKYQAIIDFEIACHYYLALDLGMTIVGSCKTDGLIDWKKAKALIKGYETIRPLKKRERKSIPYFIRYAATATSYYRFWKYHIHTPTPAAIQEPWKMVKLVEQVKKIEKSGKSLLNLL